MRPLEELRHMHDTGELVSLSRDAFLMALANAVDGERVIKAHNPPNAQAVMGMSMAAKDFGIQMFNMIETWRKSMIVGSELGRKDVDAALALALLDKDTNPFFAVHGVLINPLILAGRTAWDTAEIFKKEGQPDIAHTCYTRMYDVFPMMVYCFWSGIDLGNPIETQRLAMTKAVEFSVVMQASIHTYVEASVG